jgi:DinB superfamily
MKKLFIVAIAFVLLTVSENSFSQTLKSVLLEQLKTTHNKKNWFVPVNIALEGVTAEQAMWKDGSGNHSVGQLAYHLLFWNERALTGLKGDKEADYSGNNEETFTAFDKATWTQTVAKLDKVLTDMEKIVEGADDAKLKKMSETIANVSAHNAYHTGQIIFVRKLQKSWDPEKGVK